MSADGVTEFQDGSPTRLTSTMTHHPVRAFAVLAFAISWLCWLPLLADRQNWVSWTASPYWHLWGGLGPAIAALIVTATRSGRRGVAAVLRSTVAWRGRLPWLSLALLGPLALFAAAVAIARVVEGAWPDLSRFGSSVEYSLLPLAVFWLANLLFYGFGEEIGWRGYLQPLLQRRHSALTAALLVSVVWTVWHLPLFGITPTYRAMPAIGFLGFFFSLVTGALVLAWLYLRSNGSILVVAVFHATFDIATTTPSSRTLIPVTMGAVITVVGLAVIPSLARAAAPSSRDYGPRESVELALEMRGQQILIGAELRVSDDRDDECPGV